MLSWGRATPASRLRVSSRVGCIPMATANLVHRWHSWMFLGMQLDETACSPPTCIGRQPQALDGSDVVDYCCKVAQGEGDMESSKLLLSTAPKAAPVQSVSVLSAADALIEANSPVRRGWDFCTFDLWGVKLRQYRSNDDKYIHRPRIRPGLLLFKYHWNIRAFSSPFLSRIGARSSWNFLSHSACCRPHGRNKHSWS